MDPFTSLILLIGGAALLAAVSVLLFVRLRRDTARARRDLEDRASLLLAESRRDAENAARETRLLATEEILKLREQAGRDLADRRRELEELESRVAERERVVNRQLERLATDEDRLRSRQQEIEATRLQVLQKEAHLDQLRLQLSTQLSQVAQLTPDQAREQVLEQTRQETLHDAASLSHKLIEEARRRAEDKARHLLAIVVQRYAGEYTFESTTTSLAISGDEIKGRIIGREGRNIRAFESATGVTVLIDDTPNAVVISGFDPVRRAIAREAMARLIADGRIHPTRIEEVVAQVSREMDDQVLRLGEEAAATLRLTPLPLPIAQLLGRLRFRHSFSQNILDHSLEVARIASLLAAELGLPIDAAKRAGLLHDIGKAVSHEMEGPHALVGAELLRQHGEDAVIVNAVAAHHQEIEAIGPLAPLIAAADAISASRPGARSETLSSYLQRVENLERLGQSFEGVDKAFAVQAGRELRVLIKPGALTDDQCFTLARTICRKIEDEVQYPGQIRVTLIRETRCVEYAK